MLLLPLLKKVNEITGWLEIEEADLLACSLLKICSSLPAPHTVVEIGSYHGKSTVLLGSVLQYYSPFSKLYAIDPHEGVVGAQGQDLKQTMPSWVAFSLNTADAKLKNIEVIRDYSTNVLWNKPISFLFIDGLHDYENVSKDFFHYSEFVVVGGFVAFHDYSNYYFGVKKFVNEVLATGTYRMIACEKSLMVLQKIK